MSENAWAHFWLSVFTHLHHRGMQDGFIACVEGLTGLAEAIETVFPHTRVPFWMLHLGRNSLTYGSSNHRKELASDLKAIDSASPETAAEFPLDLFAEKGHRHAPTISTSWRTQGAQVIPFFAFSGDLGRGIAPTNATPSGELTVRKGTRKHRIFPRRLRRFPRCCLWLLRRARRNGPCPFTTGNLP